MLALAEEICGIWRGKATDARVGADPALTVQLISCKQPCRITASDGLLDLSRLQVPDYVCIDGLIPGSRVTQPGK